MGQKQTAEKDAKNQERQQTRREQEQQTPAPGADYLLSDSFASSGLPPEPNNRRLRQASILQMQRKYGNRYVMRVLGEQSDRLDGAPSRETQPQTEKATMPAPFKANNKPGTPLPYPPQETEAEEGLTSTSNGHIQRDCTDCDDEDSPDVQAKRGQVDESTLQRDIIDDALAAGKALVNKLKQMALAAVSKVKSKAKAAWSGLKNFGKSVLNQVKNRLEPAVTAVKGHWTTLKDFGSSLWDGVKSTVLGVKDSLSQQLDSMMSAIKGGWAQLEEWAVGLMEGLRGDALAVAGNLQGAAGQPEAEDDVDACVAPEETSQDDTGAEDAAAASLTGLEEQAKEAWSRLKEGWAGLLDRFSSIGASIQSTIDAVSSVVKNLANAVVAGVKAMWDNLKNLAQTLYKTLKDTARTLVDKVKSKAKSLIDGVSGLVDAVVSGLRTFLGNLVSSLMSKATAIINKLKQKVQAIIAKLEKKGRALWKKIKGKIKAIVKKLRTKVKALNRKAKAFVTGLKKKGQSIWQKIKQFGRGLVQKGGAIWARIKVAWGALSGKAQALWQKIKSYFQRLGAMSRAQARARLAAGDVVQFKPRQGVKEAAGDPQQLIRQLGEGRSLEGGVRSGMEAAYGVDFSDVRVHTGGRAAQAADSVDARAFTVGRDVAFGAGEYQSGSPIGDALIAHELAHVMQQRNGAAAGSPTAPALRGRAGGVQDAFEEEADQSAVGAVLALWTGKKEAIQQIGMDALPQLRSGLSLQRCSKPKGKEIEPTPKQMGEKNVEGMKEANKDESEKSGDSGIWYWFKYKAQVDAGKPGFAWKEDYRTGHTAAPFTKVGPFHWTLNGGQSASAALSKWLSGLTIADCASVSVAIEYNTLRSAIGNEKFDEIFGSAKASTDPKTRLVISQYAEDLPLKDYLVRPKPEIDEDIKPGDRYYWKNHEHYKYKHPGGAFRGEWAMYMGDGKWSGFGVNPKTKGEMLKVLLNNYNYSRTAFDKVQLEKKKQENGGKLPPEYLFKHEGGNLVENLGNNPSAIIAGGGGMMVPGFRPNPFKAKEAE